MRFPKYRRATTYRATVPALCGGINQVDAAHAIKDHQTTDLCNLWWKDGALRTRPGLRTADDAQMPILTYTSNQTALTELPVTVGGKTGRLLIGVGRSGMIQDRVESLLIEEDGQITTFTNDVAFGGTIHHLLPILDEKDDSTLGLLLADSAFSPLLRLKADGTTTQATPYVPTILLQVPGDGNPQAEEPAGYPYESRNLLTDAFAVSYTVGEEATYFHLPSSVRGSDFTLTVTATDDVGTVTHTLYFSSSTQVSGETYQETATVRDGYHLTADKSQATFWFEQDGQPVCMDASPYVELKAVYEPTVDQPETASIITGMRFGTWFGGDRTGLSSGTRFFVAGNPSYPHRLHYSSLNDATYFPENNYVCVGRPAEAITALKQQGNMLVIFKERELFAATYASATLSAEEMLSGGLIDVEVERALFPLTPISSAVGCDCPQSIALCGNRLVWTCSDRKVYTLHAANSKSERNLRELSAPIEPFLKTLDADSYKTAIGVDFDGCYLLLIGEDAVLFHYDEQSFYNYSSFDAGDKPGKILAWHRWKLPSDFHYVSAFSDGRNAVLLSFLNDRVVSCCLDNGQDDFFPYDVQVLSDTAEVKRPISGYFCSKLFDFGAPERKKQIKRLSPDMEAEATARVTFSYLTERGQSRTAATFCADELPTQLHPNGQRVKRFGLRCDVTGVAAFTGFGVRYEIQG